MTEETKWYDSHLETYRKLACIQSAEEYLKLYNRSIEDPESFWAEQARSFLSWDREWDFVLRYDFDKAKIEWFGGGVINAAYNCLDRHIEKGKDKTAYYWTGDSSGETRTVTYSQLYSQVNRLAGLLKSRGVARGDRVILYMPRVVELPVSMLACARIGAVHSVVFGGFSAKALSFRIQDSGARVIITADIGYRAGRAVPYKENVANAIKSCPLIDMVVVLHRSGIRTSPSLPQEVDWHEVMARPDIYVPPEPMDAEDPLFILYTSGPAGKPMGVVHTHGGYLLYAAVTTRLIFDVKDDEVLWCTSDISWITGHTVGVYGMLLNGVTGVLHEGVHWYPDDDRYWEIIERYRVNKFYTAPTVIRRLAEIGDSHIQKHDISSLNLLGTAGDILDPEAWLWYYRSVGKSRCPIVDTYFQVETGGPILAPLPGVAPLKPGSCSFPFFGIDPVILDDTGEETRFPNQEGALCIRKPWPGMVRTIFGDQELFVYTYFRRIPGIFFSADEAKKDEDGYFWVIGRIDNVIKVSGHRIGATEIESALTLHPLVTEAAVVGYPHPIKGKGIYAFVAIRRGISGSEDLKAELISLVRDEIGSIVIIDVIQWAPSLPKTRSGKILRNILDKIAAGKVDDLGDTSSLVDPSVIETLVRDRLAQNNG
jgi:acetyl-CoA synthetase